MRSAGSWGASGSSSSGTGGRGRGTSGGGGRSHVDPTASGTRTAGGGSAGAWGRKSPDPANLQVFCAKTQGLQCSALMESVPQGIFHLVTPQLKRLILEVTSGCHLPSKLKFVGGKEPMLEAARERLVSSSNDAPSPMQVGTPIEEGKPLPTRAETLMTTELLKTLAAIKKVSDPTQYHAIVSFLRYCVVVYSTMPCSRVKEVLDACGKHTAAGLTPVAVTGGVSGEKGKRQQQKSPTPAVSQGEKQLFQADVRYLCLALLAATASTTDVDFVKWQTLFPTSNFNQCSDLGIPLEDQQEPTTNSAKNSPAGGSGAGDDCGRRLNYALNHPLLGPYLLDPFVQTRAMAAQAMHVLILRGSQSVKIATEPTAKQKSSAATASFTATSTSAFYVLESILCATSVGLDSVYPRTSGAAAPTTGRIATLYQVPDDAAARAVYWGLLSAVSTQAPFPKCVSLVGYVRESFTRYPGRLSIQPKTESSAEDENNASLAECLAVATAIGAMTKTNDKSCFQLLDLVECQSADEEAEGDKETKKVGKATEETSALLSRFDYLAQDASLCSHPDIMKVLLSVIKAHVAFQAFAVTRWWGGPKTSVTAATGLFAGIDLLNKTAMSSGGDMALQKLVLDCVMAVVGETVSNTHQTAEVFRIDVATTATRSAESVQAGTTVESVAAAASAAAEATSLPQEQCQRLMDKIVLPMLSTSSKDDIKSCCYKALYKFSTAFYSRMSPNESKELYSLFVERGLKEKSDKVRGEALCGVGVLGDIVEQYAKYWPEFVQLACKAAVNDPEPSCQMRGCFALNSLALRLRREMKRMKDQAIDASTSASFPPGYALYVLNAVLTAIDHAQTRNDLTKIGHCFRCLGHLAHCFDEMSFIDEVTSRPDSDGVANALLLEFTKGLHRRKDTKEKNNALHGIGEAFLCFEIMQADPMATRTLVESLINLIKTETLVKVRSKAAAVLMRVPQEYFELYSRQVFDAVAEALRTSGHHGAFTQFKEREQAQNQLHMLMEEVLVRLNPEDREEVMARFHQHAGEEPGIGVATFIGAGGGSQLGVVKSSVRKGSQGGTAGGGGTSRGVSGGSDGSGPPAVAGGPILGGGLATRSQGGGDGDSAISEEGGERRATISEEQASSVQTD